MYQELKNIVGKYINTLPMARVLYLKKYIYNFDMNEKNIRGKIQQVAHSIDNCISRNAKVPIATIREFEFLINEISTRMIPIDDTISWALELFLIGKHQLQRVDHKVPTKSLTPPDQNTFLSAITGRRSVRKWTSEEVDINEIEAVVEAAKWAPSSCNRQLWQTLFINRQHDKKFVLEYFPNTFWLSASLLIVILMNTGLYRNNEKHFAYLDSGAFIQNMLLTLHTKGYGACWIGFKGWNSLNNIHMSADLYEKFYDYFKLNKEQIPVSMLAVGMPDIQPKAPPRQDITNIVIKDFIK